TLLNLQKNYQVIIAIIVGHSMGGVSGLRYLGTFGQDASLPKIEKFVSIGARFNDFFVTCQQQTFETEQENGPTEKSSRYL
ncbi:alpha/beta hydrolase, partial [Enterococcus faecalis]|uniref:alpha/beta hydrolase n=1 Tax=Enterococcus faecalis TaxID=1351 RepID=UPI003CC5F29D